MGHETVAGFQETEESNLGCATNDGESKNLCKSEDGSCSQTVISVPEELPSSNCCSASSVGSAVVVIDSENRSRDSVSGERAKVLKMKDEGKSWVFDVKCGEIEMWEVESVCRICRLSSEQLFKVSPPGLKMELICLG